MYHGLTIKEFGNSEVERTKKIRNAEDIRILQKNLEKVHNIENVVIMNFIELGKGWRLKWENLKK